MRYRVTYENFTDKQTDLHTDRRMDGADHYITHQWRGIKSTKFELSISETMTAMAKKTEKFGVNITV